ncbi:rodlin [Streptomyces sp. TRM 70351]|uniref:rodlin n=1 Tax=Streptomyces sp. TRM 70351 TaxID=3116552 RepID=UPI002E7B0107|nr:rodlin [Streptomyces sp. TRM 70351]MEE1928499.1 rodlin [Streptomyces sp. TRM 70351]
MIKKVLATAAVAASVVGATGAAATPALAAVGNDNAAQEAAHGNGAKNAYGNTTTGGYMSPNMSLVNGSLNKPCIAVFGKVPILINDIITDQNNVSCSENVSTVDGDDPLSHILSDIPILSENGSQNGAVNRG